MDASDIGNVERPLSFGERLKNNDAIRRLIILFAIGMIWELYARWVDNPLLLPTFGATLTTFFADLMSGLLIDRVATSLQALLPRLFCRIVTCRSADDSRGLHASRV